MRPPGRLPAFSERMLARPPFPTFLGISRPPVFILKEITAASRCFVPLVFMVVLNFCFCSKSKFRQGCQFAKLE